jgi:DNA-binding NtrC family response regulator
LDELVFPTKKDTDGWSGSDRPLRVLIVDDEPSFRNYLGRFLDREGAEVRAAESGVEALEIAEDFVPDVLLADWMLRCEMHGIELGQILRDRWPEMRLIVMTGFPTAELASAAEHGAIHGFIEKPFSLDDLGSGIRAALSLSLSMS